MSLLSRIVNVFRPHAVNREIDEELASHLADAIESGRDPREARRAFGSPLHYRERSRDVRLLAWLDSLRADAVFGWRQLLKRKVTSAAAIVSLALAIGSCTAAFRLIDALLLRPLPIAHPERLYVFARQGFGPAGNFRTSEGTEYPLFRTLRATVKGQAELVAASWPSRLDLTYTTDDDIEKASTQYVSGWMFEDFGLQPALGRLLSANDDAAPGASPVAVLSYDYWTRRFARDPRIAGRTFRIDSRVYEIVGVAPPRFSGTEPGVAVDLFLPTAMNPLVAVADSSWFRTFVHLKPGAAPSPLLDRMYGPYQAIQQERAAGMKGVPRKMLESFLHQSIILEPAASGLSDMQKDYRVALSTLGVLVALVLLIACANVANLMGAQAASRAREMALRVSIGAGRARLLQLVLVESAILAALAAAAGGWFAWWAAPFVAGRINPPGNPAYLYLPADWRVLAFAAALTLAVTCLFGLAPALRASAVHPVSALRSGAPRSHRRAMHTLVAAQVAFCVVVLFVAGLFVATFGRLSHQSTGFSSARLLDLTVTSERPQPRALWVQVADRLRATPGVERVAECSWPLLSNTDWNGFVLFHGVPANDVLAHFLNVSPGWLETMRIPLRSGRDFRPDDPPVGVAIVNEAFAKTYFHGQNPVGQSFERLQGKQAVSFQIVGLAGDALYRNMREPITATAYLPFAVPDRSHAFIVRTAAADPLAIASMLRREVPRARPEFRVSNIRTQQELVDQHTVRERLLAMLGLFFGAAALVLAAVGLYGVLDYSVLQRRREIGIRMAIGAPAANIVRGLTAEVFLMVLTGAMAGLALGSVCARYIAALLYQVKPGDAAMLALPALVMLVAAALSALPAVVRAVRIDPAVTLRTE